MQRNLFLFLFFKLSVPFTHRISTIDHISQINISSKVYKVSIHLAFLKKISDEEVHKGENRFEN